MQVLFLLDHLAPHVHLSLARLIQLFLTAVDCVAVAGTYVLLRTRWAHPQAARVVLLGLALNPVAIVLSPKAKTPLDTTTSADHRVRTRCMTNPPSTAPKPKAPSSSPYPVGLLLTL